MADCDNDCGAIVPDGDQTNPSEDLSWVWNWRGTLESDEEGRVLLDQAVAIQDYIKP